MKTNFAVFKIVLQEKTVSLIYLRTGRKVRPQCEDFDIEYNVSGRTKEKNKNTFQYKIWSKLTSEKTKELKMNDQSKQKLRFGYNQRNDKDIVAQILNMNNLANHLTFKLKLSLQKD